MTKREVDDVTGTETTGHEWDGIKELNTPLPSWWLYVLYATILISVVYWVLMPAWPGLNDYTKGVLGHSDRVDVARDMKALDSSRGEYWQKLKSVPIETVVQDPDLLEFALAAGKTAFGDNCAGCHGAGGQGARGYPNLNDDAWLWGGSLDDIHHTITVGVRSTSPETRSAQMPAFGRDGILTPAEIDDVASFVRTLSHLDADRDAATRGAIVFKQQCMACHGETGQGNRELGAPDLTDADWIYGDDWVTIRQSVANSRSGVMPTWQNRLDEETIRALSVYVHSLGGGE
jgi:cytochrome c oxidase cbb3-type subunit III